MNATLDQYFTPTSLADSLLSSWDGATPESCLDSSCGAGSLLTAAERVFGETKCIGLDRDQRLIANLRKKQPNWILSVGDVLNPQSYRRSFARSNIREADLLLLNPPFSLHNKKSITVSYRGQNVRSSIAMAHILKSTDRFDPGLGAIIIVPESVLYSETDEDARRMLAKDFKVDVVRELRNTTFTGARVNSAVIRISTKGKQSLNGEIALCHEADVHGYLVRGGLPVHELIENPNGVRFIHSCHLQRLTTHPLDHSSFPHTSCKRKGRVSGWNILVPRVGVPRKSVISAIFLDDEIQLSDCVFALSFSSKDAAHAVSSRLNAHWTDFIDQYRGTGARYVTLKRLSHWLRTKNILVSKV